MWALRKRCMYEIIIFIYIYIYIFKSDQLTTLKIKNSNNLFIAI